MSLATAENAVSSSSNRYRTWPSIRTLPRRLTATRVEATFYRSVSAHAALQKRMPQLLGHAPDHHLLCLEDMGEAADCTVMYARAVDTQNEHLVADALTWLSALHALRCRRTSVRTATCAR